LFNLKHIKERQPDILDYQTYSKYAIILPLVDYHGQESILFEVRSQQLNTQPGEICFPGGSVESEDKDEKSAAIRETCEELNINEADIKIVAPLNILITPFNTSITPFLAQINDHKIISPNKDEVEEVFYVPLEFFLTTRPETYLAKVRLRPQENFPLNLIPENYNWREGTYPIHFYIYEDHIIWGITARIVNHFVQLLKQV